MVQPVRLDLRNGDKNPQLEEVNVYNTFSHLLKIVSLSKTEIILIKNQQQLLYEFYFTMRTLTIPSSRMNNIQVKAYNVQTIMASSGKANCQKLEVFIRAR